MNAFDAAKELYREGKLLVDATREIASSNVTVRWAREDLEEDLLDLKLAVMDLDSAELATLARDVQTMISVLYEFLLYPPEENIGEGETP